MSLESVREAVERRENAAKAALNAKDAETQRRHNIQTNAATTDALEAIIATFEQHEHEAGAEARAKAQQMIAGMVTTPSPKFWMPTLPEYRASFAGGADATGGVFVPTQQAAVWFDMIRAQSVVLAANPRIVTMNSDTLNVPKIATSTSVAFYAENAAITSTEATTEAVSLTARKLAAFSLLSNEILSDSNPSIREVISYDYAAAMAAGLDNAFLEGDGNAPNISGIRYWSGTTTTPAAANGGSITLALITDAIGRHMVAGANLDTSVFFMHPRTWALLKSLTDDNYNYYMHPDITQPVVNRLFGIPVHTSTQISVTEEEGSSGAACSWLGLVDMNQVVVGRREELSIKFSEDYSFNTDSTAIRATSRWDFAPINPEAVQIIDGITA